MVPWWVHKGSIKTQHHRDVDSQGLFKRHDQLSPSVAKSAGARGTAPEMWLWACKPDVASCNFLTLHHSAAPLHPTPDEDDPKDPGNGEVVSRWGWTITAMFPDAPNSKTPLKYSPDQRQNKAKQQQRNTKQNTLPQRPRSIFLEAPSLPAKVSCTSIYDLLKAFLSLAFAEAS